MYSKNVTILERERSEFCLYILTQPVNRYSFFYSTATTRCCSGTWILNNITPAALLVPIAAIGIAFLGLEQVSYSISAPIVGKA
jgi:hypothetical protein